MKNQKLMALLSFLVIASMVLAACGPGAATEAPPEATEPPVVATEPPEAAPYAEIPYEEPLSVAAADCSYGGKIQEIAAVDRLTVQFTLCKSDPAFLAKAAFIPFAVQPREYLEYTGGTGDLLEHPVGTGPYTVSEFVRGDHLTFEAFGDYWGAPALTPTLIYRWNSEGAARLLELQAGTADFVTFIPVDSFDTVTGDPNLQLLVDRNPNIFYVGFTNTFPPFDNPDVRRAIAMGLDRQRIVDNFYPEGAEVASHFTPCPIPNGCAGDPWYEFDLDAANAALDAAGFPRDASGVRFTTSIFFRNVFRVYLPEPDLVAVEIQTQLMENLGIQAEVVEMESGEFIAQSTDGLLNGIHLLGWGGDYPHVTNFLDFHFTAANPQFGTAHPEIYEALAEASVIFDPADSEALYVEANNAIRDLVPMIPIAHGAAANAALASVSGAYTPVFGAPHFALMGSGKDTFVYIQNGEPISLYCADETDGESLDPCTQTLESLYTYDAETGNPVPALAECVGNADSTVWTCTLRDGVLFHDGSALDANDVVASWAAGIDAANPLHVGNTGGFDYFAYLWDGLINAAP